MTIHKYYIILAVIMIGAAHFFLMKDAFDIRELKERVAQLEVVRR